MSEAATSPAPPDIDKLVIVLLRAAEKYINANELYIVAKRHAEIMDMDKAQTARDAALAEWNAAKGSQ